jgi:hypothetical protein
MGLFPHPQSSILPLSALFLRIYTFLFNLEQIMNAFSDIASPFAGSHPVAQDCTVAALVPAVPAGDLQQEFPNI